MTSARPLSVFRYLFLLISMALISCSIEMLEEDEYYVEIGVPTGIVLGSKNINMGLDDPPVQLTFKLEPAGVENDSVVWSISDPSIATVSKDGVLTPLSVGSATVTVRSDSISGEQAQASSALKVVPTISTFIEGSKVARFRDPQGIVSDNDGNLYVADSNNHVIRKITSDGTVSTFAGNGGNSGWTDGTGSAARFFYPSRIVKDSSGNLYVADGYNCRIRKITPSGEVTTLAGSTSGHVDGLGSDAQFGSLTDLAIDGSGNVYVTDYDTIRKITPDGTVTTLAGDTMDSGSTDGIGSNARFYHPRGIAVDASGNLYVADLGNHTIRKITPAGDVSTLAGKAGFFGSTDGSGASARLDGPSCIVFGKSGNLYITEDSGSRIRIMTPDGTVSTYLSDNGLNISCMTINDSGVFFYTPGGNDDSIYTITPDGQSIRISGDGSSGYIDGRPEIYGLTSLGGCTMDNAGNFLVLNSGFLMKITPEGAMTSLAKVGGASTHSLDYDPYIAVDKGGNVYVVDQDETVVKKVTPDGSVTVFVGVAGTSGTSDGTGSTARFTEPSGVAVDGAGNVYVSDCGARTIRKITPDGTVSTLAGNPGNSGNNDGAGTGARFNCPCGLAVDGNGNVYVMDVGNDNIRKISPEGVVSTIFPLSGQSSPYSWTPNRIAVDGTGKPFFSYGWDINTLDSNGDLISLVSVSNVSDIYVTASGKVYIVNYGKKSIETFETRRQQ